MMRQVKAVSNIINAMLPTTHERITGNLAPNEEPALHMSGGISIELTRAQVHHGVVSQLLAWRISSDVIQLLDLHGMKRARVSVVIFHDEYEADTLVYRAGIMILISEDVSVLEVW